jgi:imidazolonepropionase-like amidohydrolase
MRCPRSLCRSAGPLFLAWALVLPTLLRAQELLIDHVRVFDGARTIENTAVLVREGRIAAVGAGLRAAAGAQVVDGSGRTLLPGLIDAHTHIQSRTDLQESLVFGVTTDLSLHMPPQLARALRAGPDGATPGDEAALFSAGFAATAPHGHGTEYGYEVPTLTGPADAQGWVDARIAEGSDFIKVMYEFGGENGKVVRPSIDRATLNAIVAAAHQRGKLVIVHIHTDEQAMDAARSGADGLAHLYLYGKDAVDPHWVRLVAHRHMFVIPTLTVLRSACGLSPGRTILDDPQLSRYLLPGDLVRLQQNISKASAQDCERPKRALAQLVAHGVAILAGTDQQNPGTAPGASLHGELEFLVEAGLTPVQALQAATSATARAFHLADRGRIAPGLRADLLLVAGDPTVDIRATRDIVAIWKAGVPCDRSVAIQK